MSSFDKGSDKEVKNLIDDKELLIKQRDELRRELKNVRNQLDHYYFAYAQVSNSLSWKITFPLRLLKRILFVNIRQYKKLFKLMLKGRWDLIFFKVRSKIQNLALSPPDVEDFEELFDESGKIIIFHPLVDWSLPLFQRPQHIAIAMAKEGYQYVYCSPGIYDGVVRKHKPIADLSLVITSYCPVIEKAVLNRGVKQKIMHIYAQDSNIKVDDVIAWQSNGGIVLYEYIDAITDDLSISRDDIIERHEYVLRDEKCIVVTTASNLYDEVARYRERNFSLVTNGVDYEHFASVKNNNTVPREIRDWVKSEKTIIGYFGALASWFDFGAVMHLAKSRPDWNILLLGWDFDGTLSKHPEIQKAKNIRVIGPIEYKLLPTYAKYFTVATIPFLINEITEATNPIKMFEYMAMGKPIVTSDLPECRKYPVVMRYTDNNGFVEKLDEAMKLCTDRVYLDQLKDQALANTWTEKGKDISKLISRAMDSNDS